MPSLTRRAPTASKQESPFERSERLLTDKRGTLEIDKEDLDNAWVQHPQLFNDVGDEQSLAQSYRDEAESYMERMSAQADGDIRRKNAAKGDKAEKLSEGQIRAMVALDPASQTATQDYNAWKLLASQWANLVKSFESRQYALRNLSSLWEKGYWTSAQHSRMPGAVGDRIADEVRRAGAER